MVVQTPVIDLVSLIEQECGIRLTLAANNRLQGPEYWGMCPIEGTGTDRFHAFPHATKPYAWCRVCGWRGDHIDILRHFKGLSFVEACEFLGLAPGESVSSSVPVYFDDGPPPAKWQEMGRLVVEKAQNYLWNKAPHALNYLYRRGFKDETIRHAKLGYVPLEKDGSWYKKPFEVWGLTDEMLTQKQRDKGRIAIPPGILIPWQINNHLWKLAVKRFEAKPGEPPYGQIAGSRDGLFNIDSLQRGRPVLLVESELDALSADQEARDLVVSVATGSTAKAQIPLWIARLASRASVTLVAFDNDDNNAGDQASEYWLDTLPHAMRWAPYSHDVNQMLQDGKSIRSWVKLGLDLATTQPDEPPLQGQAPTPLATPVLSNKEQTALAERIKAFTSRPCASCGGYGYAFRSDGRLVCPCYFEKVKAWQASKR
jgi:hypothetical protein